MLKYATLNTVLENIIYYKDETMKKFIMIALFGMATIGLANAAESAPQMMGHGPMMNPACKPLMEHMKSSHPQLEAAIKANNAEQVGKLVIANHKFMEAFVAKNPECKPPMMGGGMMDGQMHGKCGGHGMMMGGQASGAKCKMAASMPKS